MEHLKVDKRIEGFTGGSDGKEYTCNAGHHGVGKITWRREWLPTSVFFPGEFHGQRTLVEYSPWGHKELNMTEQLSIIDYSLKITPLS